MWIFVFYYFCAYLSFVNLSFDIYSFTDPEDLKNFAKEQVVNLLIISEDLHYELAQYLKSMLLKNIIVLDEGMTEVMMTMFSDEQDFSEERFEAAGYNTGEFRRAVSRLSEENQRIVNHIDTLEDELSADAELLRSHENEA